MLILLLFLYLKIRYAPLILEFLDVSTKQYQILKTFDKYSHILDTNINARVDC